MMKAVPGRAMMQIKVFAQKGLRMGPGSHGAMEQGFVASPVRQLAPLHRFRFRSG